MANPLTTDDRIQKLETAISALTVRLDALDKRGALAVPTPIPAAPPPPVPTTAHKQITRYPLLRWSSFFLGLVGIIISNAFSLVGIPALGLLLLAIFWPWKTTVATTAPKLSASPSAPAAAHPPLPPRVPSRFEQDLAKHWFSWLGIVSLIVGVALLLNYVLFKSYGLLGSVLTGYAIAAILFGLWFWLRRQYHGFAFVLQGGAWAIVYLATWALHVIPNAPIPSPSAAGGLLLAVVAIMTSAALLQRSWPLAAGAFLLGYVAVFVNDVSIFAMTALLLLSIGMVAVAVSERWSPFIVISNIATYLVFALWLTTGRADLTTEFSLALFFLILEAMIFGAAHWLTGAAKPKDEQMVLAGTVFNLVGFFLLSQYVVVSVGNTYGWMITLFLSAVVLFLAIIARSVASRRFLSTPYFVFAVVFLTVGLSEKFHGQTLYLSWILEGAAVTIVGLWSRIAALRYTGYGVSLISLILVPLWMSDATAFGSTTILSRIVLGCVSMAAYGLTAWIAARRQNDFHPFERYATTAYLDAAIGVGTWLTATQLPNAWTPFVWSTAGLGAFLLGTKYSRQNLRVVAYLLAIMSIVHWIGLEMDSRDLLGSVHITARLAVGAWMVALLGAQSWHARTEADRLPAGERAISRVWAWGAVALSTLVLGIEIPIRTLSIVWGLEGILLFIIGFTTSNATARRQGLAVLALTIAKVYLYDVQTLTTPYRILSFIILGVILLFIGFLYNRWRQQAPKKNTPA